MHGLLMPSMMRMVALLAEGVDRNFITATYEDCYLPSPSSRRAWIEILIVSERQKPDFVALLAEGVDRNRRSSSALAVVPSRPPRGGRG